LPTRHGLSFDHRTVLEVGCGTGPLLARIEDDYEEVLGVDVTEPMLEVPLGDRDGPTTLHAVK
jgi:ubiquinone/menaquinone biosynthesis C-methylase UbiE